MLYQVPLPVETPNNTLIVDSNPIHQQSLQPTTINNNNTTIIPSTTGSIRERSGRQNNRQSNNNDGQRRSVRRFNNDSSNSLFQTFYFPTRQRRSSSVSSHNSRGSSDISTSSSSSNNISASSNSSTTSQISDTATNSIGAISCILNSTLQSELIIDQLVVNALQQTADSQLIARPAVNNSIIHTTTTTTTTPAAAAAAASSSLTDPKLRLITIGGQAKIIRLTRELCDAVISKISLQNPMMDYQLPGWRNQIMIALDRLCLPIPHNTPTIVVEDDTVVMMEHIDSLMMQEVNNETSTIDSINTIDAICNTIDEINNTFTNNDNDNNTCTNNDTNTNNDNNNDDDDEKLRCSTKLDILAETARNCFERDCCRVPGWPRVRLEVDSNGRAFVAVQPDILL